MKEKPESKKPLKTRIILHCDCNSFYASVELLSHPELAGQPVAVCGSVEDRRGIILAKNEPAKRKGVQTAETVWQARRKCPQLVLLPPHHDRYAAISKKINEIYAKYTDRVEPFSVDESWLDVTDTLHLFAKSGKELADRLRAEVKAETGVSISVGVSFNKVLAKLGSDYKKPDATTVIEEKELREMVWPMPVERLLFVGEKTRGALHKMGIHTIGQLAAAPAEALAERLGKLGPQLRGYARGEEHEPVRRTDEEREVKSIGNSTTFRRNLESAEDRRVAVLALADKVAGRLRAHGLYAGTVQVSMKDPSLRVVSRQKKLPCESFLAKDIAKAALELIEAAWPKNAPIRMLAVTAASLSPKPEPAQLSLFEKPPEPDKKQEKLERAMDSIRKKYGRDAIGEASVMKNDLGIGLLDPKHGED